MKRVCIFVFFDKDGIVDNYILFLLEKLKPYFEKLLVVSNGLLDNCNKQRLLRFSDILVERENKGFDFGAWKQIIFSNRFGIRFLEKFDEIFFINDTFYGPICGLDDVFEDFDKSTCDIWGLTRFGETMEGNTLYPPFIQTYFWACKRKIFSDETFWKFWESIDENVTDFSIVCKYEKELSRLFTNANYTIKTYIDSSDYEFSTNLVCNRIAFNRAIDKYELYTLIQRGFPFIKRKNFFYDNSKIQEMKLGEDLRRVINYVNEKHLYDISLIFENVLRISHPNAIVQNLHLNFVINSISSNSISEISDVLLIFQINDYDHWNLVKDRIEETRYKYILFIKDFQLFKKLKNEKKCCFKSNGIEHDISHVRDIIPCMKYICCVTDIEHLKDNNFLYTSYTKLLVNSLVKNDFYIDNIVKTFEENPYLGILYPQWDINLHHIERNSRQNRQYGFWIKTEILCKVILKYKKEKRRLRKWNGLERLFYEIDRCLRDCSKCYGTVTTDEFASILITNCTNTIV